MPLYEADLGNESEYVATKGLQYVPYRIGTVKGVRLDLDAHNVDLKSPLWADAMIQISVIFRSSDVGLEARFG